MNSRLFSIVLLICQLWIGDSFVVGNNRHQRDVEDDDYDEFPSNDDHPIVSNSNIEGSFSNKRSFSCPRVKPILHTGDGISNLSPEDIDIVGAMGDALATGRGLWSGTDVDFRGAAFPIGGDANIDGLVTIPNILLEFNDRIEGTSHGMGDRDVLQRYQFNVAVSSSETEDLPEQAIELVRRIARYTRNLDEKWVLVTIATGTEEFCYHCDTPHLASIRKALGILRKGIPKVMVVLLGPVHVASSYSLNINLLKPRCPCLESISKNRYMQLMSEWKKVFVDVQNEFNNLKYETFGVLAIPQLTIHSREPYTLFVDNKPLLNRKGHSYAAKWLWNRLIAGPNYNISDAVFSEESYYCPALACPYFRTIQNLQNCTVQTEQNYKIQHATTISPNTTPKPHRQKVQEHQWGIIALIVGLAFVSATSFGTFFYCRTLSATRTRREPEDHHLGAPEPIPDAKLGG